MINIISGIFKGTKLHVPSTARPTTNRVRKVLFDVLLPHIPGARVLDAFAGSGACGIEALSLGASEVVFLEKDKKACLMLQKNITRLKISEITTVLNLNFFTFSDMQKFDIIILDPPYEKYQFSQLLAKTNTLSKQDKIIVYETNTELEPNIIFNKAKKMGSVRLYFFV